MSPGVREILSWQLGVVDAQAAHVDTDATTFDTLGTDLRSDTDRTLDAMSGETIEAANDTAEQLVRRVFDYADALEQTGKVLGAFAAEVSVQQTRLRSVVEEIESEGWTVDDDGTVSGPPGESPSTVNRMEGLSDEVVSALKAIRDSDRMAAALLGEMYGAEAPAGPIAPNYGDNWGTETTLAGAIASAKTDSLAALLQEEALKSGDDALGSVKAVSRGLGPFGNVLGLAAGIYGAPDDEPLSETVVAEGGGMLAGLAAGAAAGSIVPGVGTVAGALIGVGAAAAASWWTSGKIRDGFDDRRSEMYARGEA